MKAVHALVELRAPVALLLTNRQTETKVLGQLVLRVQTVSEVDATHATVGVYLCLPSTNKNSLSQPHTTSSQSVIPSANLSSRPVQYSVHKVIKRRNGGS